MQQTVEPATLRTRLAAAQHRVRLTLDQTRAGRFVLDILRGTGAVIQHIRKEPVLNPAAALAYGTLLSIVPLLGLVLAIAGAVRQVEIRDRVHEAIFTFLAPGVQQASQEYLEELIHRATSGGVVSLSGGVLLFTSVMLLRSVEKTLNEIWEVRTLRDWRIRLATYLLILILGPVLLGVSLVATAALRHRVFEHVPFGMVGLSLAPVAAAVLGLTVLYWLAPNAPVRKRAALAGGVVSGVAFEIAKYGYTFYTSHFVHYNVIYGSLGAIPLFLVWVYVAWVILLFGAQLAYAVQHAGALRLTALPQTEAMRARLAARTMLAAAVAVAAKTPAPSIDAISRAIGVSGIAVGESVRILMAGGLLAEDRDGGLVPARSADTISLADIARVAQAAAPAEATVLGRDAASQAVAQVFQRSETASIEPLSEVTLQAMAATLVGGGSSAA